ncbi:PrsW family glutamic-type intramembrane protease [Streptomyces sp. ST2-7A]|uniref:PrsW family glutamic-type intramembrane protease n=1 Tax=Streptomyces sp. ST2-7A TaxID=2907214 RepID=UPI001F1D65D8|nr:PrsW family glutamic-type intramembrane protease [Streptomyces sp. ST2-7A]MCE7080517.1 PrsW family intramembrane metalloprotease [Streptomyces sp. ST2-7A]
MTSRRVPPRDHPVAPPQRPAGSRLARLGLLLGCLAGLAILVHTFLPVIRVLPRAAELAALLLVPVLLLGFAVLRRITPVVAPALTPCLAAVAWGATAAAGCAVLANTGLLGIWAWAIGPADTDRWGAALTAPLNEELLKVAGVALVALAAPRHVRGPIDGFVIGGLVGLGFQMTENWIHAVNSVITTGGTAQPAPIVETVAVRVGVTGLGSHWAMTAVAGTGVGLLAARTGTPLLRRLLGAALCLLVAMALHTFFDAPVPAGLSPLAANLLHAGAVFVTALLFYLVLRHRYRARLRACARRTGLSEDLLTRRSRRRALRPIEPGLQRKRVAAEQRTDLLRLTGCAHGPRAR